eukprot:gene9886-20571_t
MSNFAFRFHVADAIGDHCEKSVPQSQGAHESMESIHSVLVEWSNNGLRQVGAGHLITIANQSFYKVSPPESNCDSDIVPGVYEGGLKLWECSKDLVEHLLQGLASPVGPGAAIELGCGHGLPGIAALLSSYCPVVFSDLNLEVLESITKRNIQLNCLNLIRNSVLVAGDWTALSRDLHSNFHGLPVEYALIVSAETLYTSSSCAKIFAFIRAHLAKSGVAVLATKRYYFGVGGGTQAFLDLIAQNDDSGLKANVVKVFEDGQSNIREIIEVHRD